jgi:hypothetical protein
MKEGGLYAPTPSTVLYLLLNVAVAAAGFGIIFGLTYLLPPVIRRYWGRLNTVIALTHVIQGGGKRRVFHFIKHSTP